MAKRDVGQLPGWWDQIVQDRRTEAQIFLYSAVEYTIGYMYRAIALRTDLNVVIFKRRIVAIQDPGSGHME